MDPVLDGTGSLAGQRLTLGVTGGQVRQLDLAPESSASGPTRGVVLVTEDDGSESRLRLLDAARGCERVLAAERSVIRGALLSPDGSGTWEHRVNRVTRADEGVWHRPLPGGTARRVLPGLPADGRFGPTFGTELGWLSDGRLGVAACGEVACRVRVVDPLTGRSVAFDGTGALLGVHGDTAVAQEACHGLPCGIVAVDLRTGRHSTLVDVAGPAVVSDGTLVFATSSGALRTLDLESGRRTTVAGDAGLLPVRRTSAATSGAATPAGSVLVAPGGRLERPSGGLQLDPVSGTSVQIGENQP
jgi:outer membrane protein assembly factor BamB